MNAHVTEASTETADAQVSQTAQSGGELVEGRQASALETIANVSRERWLDHAEFARKQATLWSAYATTERDPQRRERYSRDATMNWNIAEFAMKQGLFGSADEVCDVAA